MLERTTGNSNTGWPRGRGYGAGHWFKRPVTLAGGAVHCFAKKLAKSSGSAHHQECPIRLGKFSRMRNHSISKTATAELGRARLACSSINTCAVGPRPRPDLSSQRCCKLRLKLLLVESLLVDQLAKKT